ncbi:hypothetical protein ACIPRI_14725 [Variovorax sp. LARHSF232]
MDDSIESIMEYATNPPRIPTKSFTEILATGIKHAGGLAQLAQAEKVAEKCSPTTPEAPTA